MRPLPVFLLLLVAASAPSAQQVLPEDYPFVGLPSQYLLAQMGTPDSVNPSLEPVGCQVLGYIRGSEHFAFDAHDGQVYSVSHSVKYSDPVVRREVFTEMRSAFFESIGEPLITYRDGLRVYTWKKDGYDFRLMESPANNVLVYGYMMNH